MSQKWLIRLLGCTALLGLALAQQAGPRFVPFGERPLMGPLDFLKPIAKYASGRVWTLTQGLEPRLAAALTGESEGQGFQSEFSAASSLYSPFTRSPMLQAASAALVPFRDPAPAFSRGVLITRDLGDVPIQTEPHMAVNPKDPDNIVVGAIDYNMSTNVTYVTQDGGATWEGPFQVPYLLDDVANFGDPVLAFDRASKLYMTGISAGIEEFEVGGFKLSTVVSSMSVARSEDGGFSFPLTFSSARANIITEGITQDQSGRMRGQIIIGFLDKPWIATGPNPKDPSKDNVYVIYTNFQTIYEPVYIGEAFTLNPTQTRSTIQFVASEDNGVTWSKPLNISPVVRESYQDGSDAGGAEGTKRFVQGGNVAVAPDGSVYTAYFDSTDDGGQKGQAEIYLSRSTDGGKTFARASRATTFTELPYKPRTSNFRFFGSAFPQLATGPKGEVYLVYTGRSTSTPSDDGDVFFVKTTDNGKNFSRPKRLNADETNRVQFFPAIATSPKGNIHVMWGDTRDDKNQTRFNIYYTKSEDGGDTWGFEDKQNNIKSGDARVTDFASNPNKGFPGGQFIGDYFAIKATDEDVYMIWPDMRLGEFGGFSQKIGFARQRPIKQPEIFVSPSAGPGGQAVTIQGFNYQPDSTIYVLLGDGAIASARSNLEGRFSTTFFMPVTGEGAQNMRVVDASGNLASASYFTDFGFNNIQTLLKGLQQPGTSDPDLGKLLAEIQKSQTQVKDLQQQLAQVQKANQQLYQQIQQRLDQIQKSLPKK